MSLATRVLLGLVAGLILGLLLAGVEAGWAATAVAWIEPLGGLWVNAIRMTVIPLLVSLLLVGITSAGSRAAVRLGGRTVVWFVGLVGVSAALGGLLSPLLLGLLGADATRLPELAGRAAATDVALPPFRDWVVGLLPANPVAAAAEGAILPLVLFTVLFGLAATGIAEEHRDRILGAARAVADTMFVIIEWILAAAPVGVFALTLGLAFQTGPGIVAAVAGFLITACGLVVVATLLLYPLVALRSPYGPRAFARAAAPAQAVGFSTRSSLATLPVLLEEAEETLRIPAEVAGLVLPTAVSVFKYASPVVRISGTFFVAALFGVELGTLEAAAVVVGIGALSFYSPGIPSGGLFVMAPLYQAFGLPLEGIGILIALDIVPDMFITASNVTANLAVAAVLTPRGAASESAGPPREVPGEPSSGDGGRRPGPRAGRDGVAPGDVSPSAPAPSRTVGRRVDGG
jgi:Na+/H+-dicarboxylate symporter